MPRVAPQFSRIAAGVNHVVALTVDGKVMTFGSGRRQVANPNLDVFKPAELLQRSLIDEAPSPLGRTARGRCVARPASRCGLVGRFLRSPRH